MEHLTSLSFSLSLSLSLSHSALYLALSGWAAPRWQRVCVHSGACRASPPPGPTTRFCSPPLKITPHPPVSYSSLLCLVLCPPPLCTTSVSSPFCRVLALAPGYNGCSGASGCPLGILSLALSLSISPLWVPHQIYYLTHS